MMDITPENALDYLRKRGHLGAGTASVTALGWGVSNAVLRVDSPQGTFILKQSRPQLRTRDLWVSDIERVWREQEVMETLGPLLPVGIVPRILFCDRDHYVFAMSHAPMESRVWKESLLLGEVDHSLGELTGSILGRIHQQTSERLDLIERFADRKVFVQLRVDPFYRRIQERCPDVADAVTPLIEQMMELREALCHGDYSPKNILTHTTGFMLVDYETAHLGDPTMDLGFFLSHLMLKSIKRRTQRDLFHELTRLFWKGYAREGTFRPVEELQRRGIAHFGLCVLSRVDGTSPVDYLTEANERESARQLGRRVLLESPKTWEEVLALASDLA